MPEGGNLNTRAEKFEFLHQPFDLLVVGGGATGLGIAVDAATRGYRTALVEAGDFAQATSSRATKLVHGGVRYLASGQLPLVYEALRERRIMLQNAPHLVRALAFVTPAYAWWQLPWYGAGLKLYDLLSRGSSLGPTSLLGAAKTLERLPGLAAAGLKGGVVYHDGQFDDARLALALARTAEDHGATILNYARCTRLLKEQNRLVGATVEDVESGRACEVRAGAVINATGIFSDALRRQDTPGLDPLLSLSRGTHIVVDASFLSGRPDARANGSQNGSVARSQDGSASGLASAIMVPRTPDGRIVFAIPWLGRTLIGTTDLPAEAAAMEPGHSPGEIDFLLQTVNPYLARPVQRADILSVFSGLRPLVTGPQAKTSKLSREHHIEVSPSGLVTIAGGKWTTYRRMAEQTLDFAIAHGLLAPRACVSRGIRLHGAPSAAQGSAVPAELETDLSQYGTDAPAVRQLLTEGPAQAQLLDAGLPYTAAQVVFAVRSEMARTVEDVLSRRTRALLLDARAAERAAPLTAGLMAAELGLGPEWIADQVHSFAQLARSFYLAPQ